MGSQVASNFNNTAKESGEQANAVAKVQSEEVVDMRRVRGVSRKDLVLVEDVISGGV